MNNIVIAHAVLYVERFGFSVIPLGKDKRPSVKWAEYQERRPTLKEILEWPMENVAIVTGAISGIVVVDCESREDAVWFWEERGKTSAVVKTKRGFHLYYRHPDERVRNATKVENRYDVRGDGGYVAAPPSQHSQGRYKWVWPIGEVAKLPRFDPKWRPETTYSTDDPGKIIRDGRQYIGKIFAKSGEGGHANTFRAACRLRDSGMDELEALVSLEDWNTTNADPPWSKRELLHKIREAYR